MFSYYIKLSTYLRNPVLLSPNPEENTKFSTNHNGFNPFWWFDPIQRIQCIPIFGFNPFWENSFTRSSGQSYASCKPRSSPAQTKDVNENIIHTLDIELRLRVLKIEGLRVLKVLKIFLPVSIITISWQCSPSCCVCVFVSVCDFVCVCVYFNNLQLPWLQ